MNKKFKQMVISMAAFIAAAGANAWEKMTEADKDTSVRVVKKAEYVKTEKIEATTAAPIFFNINGDIRGRGTFSDKDARYNLRTGMTTYKNMDMVNTFAIQGNSGPRVINPAPVESHQYTDLYLDLDGNPATVEGIATVCTDCPDVKMDVHNISATNATLTVGEIFNLGKHDCMHKHSVTIARRSAEKQK